VSDDADTTDGATVSDDADTTDAVTASDDADATDAPDRTVLVTGATGTVGSAVVAALADDPVTVRAATRSPDGLAADDLPANATPVAFDFERPETWGAAFEGVDALFLVRPPGGVSLSRVTDALDAALRVGVSHVVLLSVLGAEKNPLLPHRRLEKHLEASDATYTFLRASFFCQNLSEVHRREILADGEIFVPAGDGETSFVDARDVAAVGARALSEAGHEDVAYDVTGPEALTYHEVASVFSDVLAREVTYLEPSTLAFARRMLARGESPGFVVVMLGIYATARFGLAGRVTDDVARVLGREPRSVRAFVEDYADAFRVG
jgi:uncharacterized protein YbjT (DUF2867 family)